VPRLVPKKQPDQPKETGHSGHNPPPAVSFWERSGLVHPYPHARLRCTQSFNYYRGSTLLGRFVKDEFQNVNDPLVKQAWAEYPLMFEEELVS
jgi:hypothetical protein